MTNSQSRPALADEHISFRRNWIEHIRDGLVAMGKLPSGPLGDWAFLFREQLTDALNQPRSPSLYSGTAVCTICAGADSPGFYTGCLINDGHGSGEWQCDGKGNLTPTTPPRDAERETIERTIDLAFEQAARAEGWFDTGHRGHATGWPMFAKPGFDGNGFARDWEHLCRSFNIALPSIPSREGSYTGGVWPPVRDTSWDWLPLDHRPLKTGTYLVGHRGYQEILKFFGPDIHWCPGTQMGWRRLGKNGWQRDDPAGRFNATHCVLIESPTREDKSND